MDPDPPFPRVPIGIGITGHRPNKLPRAAIPRLAQQLRDTMATLDDMARKSGVRAIRLVSNFAEGTDQMATEAAPKDWTVEAILPFPRDEFLKDFEQSAAGDSRDVREEFRSSLGRAATVTELPTPAGRREEGYVAAGRAMLDCIDLLIAVWDGAAPKPGGTGQIVKEATERKIPVVWLQPAADREPVVIERFQDGTPVVSNKPWTAALKYSARPRASGDPKSGA
jgi:hypothetical protein